uniref:Uncharacterized protein n=1 Tax=Cucumis melo TaxID=3656 RepID=A0A9I9ECH8_CUCME
MDQARQTIGPGYKPNKQMGPSLECQESMLQGVIFSSCDKQMSTNLLHRWDDEGGCDSIAVGFSILTRDDWGENEGKIFGLWLKCSQVHTRMTKIGRGQE